MSYSEAKEHTPGRLHALFADPYRAFENDTDERQLHINVMLHALLAGPIQRGQVTLRVIHGWENGGCEPDDLQHVDVDLQRLDDVHATAQTFIRAAEQKAPLPTDDTAALATPLEKAISEAEAEGNPVAQDVRTTPARWPAFEGGLALYTLFKMYHRLVYGEDDTYRCSQCDTPHGPCELHEFHLEEGEFALLVPIDEAPDAPYLLILHESQLEPIYQLLAQSLPLFERF